MPPPSTVAVAAADSSPWAAAANRSWCFLEERRNTKKDVRPTGLRATAPLMRAAHFLRTRPYWGHRLVCPSMSSRSNSRASPTCGALFVKRELRRFVYHGACVLTLVFDASYAEHAGYVFARPPCFPLQPRFHDSPAATLLVCNRNDWHIALSLTYGPTIE